MRSSQKLRRKGVKRQKSPHPQAAASPKTTSDACKASAAAEKKTRGKPARAVARHPDTKHPAVSPVLHTPQTPASDGHFSQNGSTCSGRKPARGWRKQTEKSERSGRCPDTTQRKRQNACTRRSRADKETHATLTCPSSPQDMPLSSPKSDPGEGTPRPRRGRPPKQRLSSTPRRSRTPPSLPQISPVAKTQLEKSVFSQNPKAQQRKRTRKKAEQEVLDTPPVKRQRKKRSAKAEPRHSQRIRTRFVLDESELREPEETLSSSDLSIELSAQEEKLPLVHTLVLEEEEEELPCFLQQIRQKPPSIREGLCVWCKLRKYPFWPAVVKSVNHKTKKANIVFIDVCLITNRMSKGLSVSLRTLKEFDCEESHHFVDMAKEKYGEDIVMCLAFISDYHIRIGCGSFVGSVLDYIADDISQPLRREYFRASSDLASPTQSLMEQIGDSELQEHEEHQDLQVIKKVLPDRTLAARNRANQRLVDYIVKKKGAQDRLLVQNRSMCMCVCIWCVSDCVVLQAVIRGRQASRWLQDLRSCSRAMVEQVYLEDEKQVDAVYHYLEELWQSVAKANRHLAKSDRIRYILDVLFPEALIYAISSVDSISLDKAEEKYRQGPRHSNRERQAFDLLIEQQMRLKADDSL